MYITQKFELDKSARAHLASLTPSFGYPQSGFGEYIYYRHFSRLIHWDGDINQEPIGQEQWSDTVERVINGVFSIRKDWYFRNRIRWNEAHWQRYAFKMAQSLFRMEWLPPGRGLWAMGTKVVAERGAMPLYNCAYTEIGKDWIEDLCWVMDLLMNGCGVGFGPKRTALDLWMPEWQEPCERFTIPDSREGWVQAVRTKLESYQGGPVYDYDPSEVRPAGSLIRTFGGVASGPGPLMDLLKDIDVLCMMYIRGKIDVIQLFTDLANVIGVCVISGNVRRSAEIAVCDLDDPSFLHLKDYEKHPYRERWGWMSNNTVRMREDEDFEHLDVVAFQSARGRDLGFLNQKNFRHGRIGKFHDHDEFGIRLDVADGLNPCGEIPLENREVCNLAETLPTRCVNTARWLDACEYASCYASTVALLPTHHPSTNAVVARNRRIGVSLIDYTGWKHEVGVRRVIAAMRKGYRRIREVNHRLADEAGVPRSLRVTTIKPGGTVPKLAGRVSGVGHPTFAHTFRRVDVPDGSPIAKLLIEAGVPHEPHVWTKGTFKFGFPILQGPACPATEVSIWEQAANLVTVQREWSDNAVSNTLYFKPMWVLADQGNVSTDDKGRAVTLGDPDGEFYPWDIYHETQAKGQRYVEHHIGVNRYKFRFDKETDDWKFYVFNKDHEEGDLEAVLAHIAPYVKSVSLLPHTLKGIWPQMPEEGISESRYNELLQQIKPIDWSQYFGGDGLDERYCTGESCESPA